MVAFHLMYGLLIRLVILFICFYFMRCFHLHTFLSFHEIDFTNSHAKLKHNVLSFAKLVGSILCPFMF
jgi:hypothetical protein